MQTPASKRNDAPANPNAKPPVARSTSQAHRPGHRSTCGGDPTRQFRGLVPSEDGPGRCPVQGNQPRPSMRSFIDGVAVHVPIELLLADGQRTTQGLQHVQERAREERLRLGGVRILEIHDGCVCAGHQFLRGLEVEVPGILQCALMAYLATFEMEHVVLHRARQPARVPVRAQANVPHALPAGTNHLPGIFLQLVHADRQPRARAHVLIHHGHRIGKVLGIFVHQGLQLRPCLFQVGSQQFRVRFRHVDRFGAASIRPIHPHRFSNLWDVVEIPCDFRRLGHQHVGLSFRRAAEHHPFFHDILQDLLQLLFSAHRSQQPLSLMRERAIATWRSRPQHGHDFAPAIFRLFLLHP
mmetsp:Transcript_5544/g.34314  ORF Transcript_5544/g.34314 Transcript_5544/m.34314 type:complete len:354 (+) Transcript_5544:614-1675(+)